MIGMGKPLLIEEGGRKPYVPSTKAEKPNPRAALLAMLIFALLGLRFYCEGQMLEAYGSDPQLGIWHLEIFTKMGFWTFTGLGFGWMLAAHDRPRRGRIAGGILLSLWLAGILYSSWGYHRAAVALRDAQNPKASAMRLEQLAHFDGIQAGYRLDNMIASNPNTPETTLRFLATKKDQVGTLISIAVNPSTPDDLFKETVAELRKSRWYPQSEVDRIVRQREETIAKRLDPQNATIDEVTP